MASTMTIRLVLAGGTPFSVRRFCDTKSTLPVSLPLVPAVARFPDSPSSPTDTLLFLPASARAVAQKLPQPPRAARPQLRAFHQIAPQFSRSLDSARRGMGRARRCTMRAVPRVPPFDRPATYEDLVKLPDHLVAEILGGELHASPRPAPRHAVAYARAMGLLESAFDSGRTGPGGWWILAEPELHLGPDVLVPDLAGWRRTRTPRVPETAYFPLAPDWILRDSSPRSTASLDRTQKLASYAREGCRPRVVDSIPIASHARDPAPRGSARWTAVATSRR